jgi:hypothetical protein
LITNPLSAYVKAHAQKVQGCTCPSQHDRWDDFSRYIDALGSRKEFYVQPKIDGTRVFLLKGEQHSLMATKHNGLYGPETYPELFKTIAAMKIPGRTTLDGEFVKKEERLYLFDVLTYQGMKMEDRPLRERGTFLQQIFFTGFYNATESRLMYVPTYTIVPSEGHPALLQIQSLFESLLVEGYEGVIVKDPEARYGGIHSWQKVRAEETVDCWVRDLLRRDTGETSYELAVYDAKGDEVYIGDVYSCIEDVDRSKIQIGTVLEVRYEPTPGFKKLRFPAVLRIRDDKPKDECLLEQVSQLAPSGVKNGIIYAHTNARDRRATTTNITRVLVVVSFRG